MRLTILTFYFVIYNRLCLIIIIIAAIISIVKALFKFNYIVLELVEEWI